MLVPVFDLYQGFEASIQTSDDVPLSQTDVDYSRSLNQHSTSIRVRYWL